MNDYRIEPVSYTITIRASHVPDRFPIGFASIQIVEENGERIGKLVGLLRHPNYSDLGVCRDLFLKRIEICKTLGCNKIYSAVYYKRKGIIDMIVEYGFKEIEPLTKEYRRFELII